MMANNVVYQTSSRPINPLSALTVTVTATLLIFERGKLSTSRQQVPLAHVADVDALQSMTQKARGVGSVVVHVHRGQGFERVQLDDLPDFQVVHECINEMTRRARVTEQRMRQTHHYAPMPPPSPQPAQAPAVTPTPSSDEILGQLERLGKLRDAGVLSEDEFQAKKADLLRRL